MVLKNILSVLIGAGMLAWSAVRAAGGGLRDTGALGPVEAFGLRELEAGAAEAGISETS